MPRNSEPVNKIGKNGNKFRMIQAGPVKSNKTSENFHSIQIYMDFQRNWEIS
jgi:hypothetical protein